MPIISAILTESASAIGRVRFHTLNALPMIEIVSNAFALPLFAQRSSACFAKSVAYSPPRAFSKRPNEHASVSLSYTLPPIWLFSPIL